jgi:hypothetical protein
MQYQVHRTKDFEGTDWVEIGPGTYDGKHWQPGFLYISEENFVPAELIVGRHLPGYDHYAMNNVPRDAGLAIVEDWRRTGVELRSSARQAFEILSVRGNNEISPLSIEPNSIENNRNQIAAMLKTLASSCEEFIRDAEGFCILGL